VNTGAGPVLPFPVDEDEEDEDGDEPAEAVRPEPTDQQRQAAKATMEDFTKTTLRKKDRELADIQFGGDGTTGPKTVNGGAKVGRNDPCPCGSGKKYKKCHGS